MEKIIGRLSELSRLRDYYDSGRNEFIAIYGRRRVGKTFLIRSFFKDRFDFHVTGVIDGSMGTEMEVFNNALKYYGFKGAFAKTWIQAFDNLTILLERKAKRKKSGRLVVFIDELPCFDTHRSGFVQALDQFWNAHASRIENIFFVICGSATSWMMKNIINSKAGLHKRTTHTIHLHPFTLSETENYLKEHKFRWPRISIMQIYMILGGVPYYLSLLNPRENVPDNIDTLFFSQDAELENEYHLLFRSLFKNADAYMDILKFLSNRRDGYCMNEIATGLKIHNNGHLSRMLDDLEHCDFIRVYNNGAGKKNNSIYQLIDFFSLFYHRYGYRRITDEHFWRNSLGTPEQNTWFGLAFERVCMCHTHQIIKGLKLDAIGHEYYAWRSKTSTPSVQIDLVIDRADGIATICEIKYSKDAYVLTEKEYLNIIRRMETFQRESGHKGGIQVCIITTYELSDNMYSDISPVPITMRDLFS